MYLTNRKIFKSDNIVLQQWDKHVTPMPYQRVNLGPLQRINEHHVGTMIFLFTLRPATPALVMHLKQTL